jgi:hypothetical protein
LMDFSEFPSNVRFWRAHLRYDRGHSIEKTT